MSRQLIARNLTKNCRICKEVTERIFLYANQSTSNLYHRFSRFTIMHSFILLLSCVFCVLMYSAHADTIPQSRRTGAEFDLADIRYFKLFRRVDSLQSASFVPSRYSDSVAVQARRFSLPDTTFNIHVSTAASIIGYIDNFEAIFTNSYSVEWDSIAAFVSPVRPFYQQRSTVIRTLDSTDHIGILFTATDSLLLLYTGNTPCDWASYTTTAMEILPYNKIASVDGRYIGGSGAMYLSALPYLREGVFFWGALPPECSAILRSYTMKTPQPIADEVEVDRIVEEHYLRRWQIAGYGGIAHMAAQFGLSRALGVAVDTDHDPRRYASYPFAGVDVQYNPNRFVSFGVFGATFPDVLKTGHVIEKDKIDTKDLSGWTAGATVGYRLVSVTPQLDNPLEWKIGTGIAYNWVYVTTTRTVLDITHGRATSVRRRTVVSEPGSAMSLMLSTALQYYFSSSFSLRLSGEAIAGEAMYARVGTADSMESASHRTGINMDRLTLMLGVCWCL